MISEKSLKEGYHTSDYLHTEKEILASIYLDEFKKHYEIIQTKDKLVQIDHELIFSFIFLQLYIECFFHQKMRKLVEEEFIPPRKWIGQKWTEGENRYIPDKLKSFCGLFYVSSDKSIQDMLDTIIEPYKKLTIIRDLLVHGHKIAEWDDSNGDSGKTKTYSELTSDNLNLNIKRLNKMGLTWNQLLGENILPRLTTLHSVDSFKFSQI